MKKLLLIVLFFLAAPGVSHAAIAFDAYTNGDGKFAGETTLTYSHTTSGSNRILIVSVAKTDGGDSVTGVTYAGTAMTQAIKSQWNPNANSWVYFYYLLNPASGANNVVVTVSSNTNQFTSNSASYTGAAQSGTPDTAFYSGNDAAGDYVATVNVTTANSWMASIFKSADASPVSTVNATTRSSSVASNPNFQDSGAAVGSGNQTIGYHWNDADRKIIIAIAFAPAAEAAAPSPSFGNTYSYWW